jgi:hypothetical protein
MDNVRNLASKDAFFRLSSSTSVALTNQQLKPGKTFIVNTYWLFGPRVLAGWVYVQDEPTAAQ